MDIRKGFARLARFFLILIWAAFLFAGIAEGNPAEFGENLFYMLVFTLVYMLVCKGIAWVYNGFFSKT